MQFYRKMPFALVLATILLPIFRTTQAQPSNAFKLTVQVSDLSGAEIPDAKVSVSAVTPSPDFAPLAITTDRRGTASAELKPGTYKVSIGASGFRSYYQQLRIDGPKPLSIRLQVSRYDRPTLVVPLINPALVPRTRRIDELIPETPN